MFIAYLTELELPQEELDSSIIGAIGDMDGPMPADTKGWASLRRHLMGHTDETRQRFRDEVRESFVRAVEPRWNIVQPKWDIRHASVEEYPNSQ